MWVREARLRGGLRLGPGYLDVWEVRARGWCYAGWVSCCGGGRAGAGQGLASGLCREWRRRGGGGGRARRSFDGGGG